MNTSRKYSGFILPTVLALLLTLFVVQVLTGCSQSQAAVSEEPAIVDIGQTAVASEQPDLENEPVTPGGEGLTGYLPWVQKEQVPGANSELRFGDISQNANQIPLYEKFEATFQVQGSVAINTDFPYDPVPPPGLAGRVGLSVEALILPPGVNNWQQAVRQPGFVYQAFDRVVRGDGEGLSAQGEPVWKVRFAPNQIGTWKYKLRAQDASVCPIGLNPCPYWIESTEGSFQATPAAPGTHGFIQVSSTDQRYFEFSDESPFIGLGHQTSFGANTQVEGTFDNYQQNGVNFLRTWMSATGVYGLGFWFWDNWSNSSLVFDPVLPGSDVSAVIRGIGDSPCIFQGFGEGAQTALEGNTSYTLEITARLEGIVGPRVGGAPYGLVAKFGGWPKGICGEPGNDLITLSPYWNAAEGWTTYQATFSLPSDTIIGWDGYFTIALENTSDGYAYIDEVQISQGQGEPNLMVRGRMNYHLYFDQASGYRWDRILDAAAERNIFLKIVILEKQDPIFGSINSDGTIAPEPNDDNFYGRHPSGSHSDTKVRRLHEYFWRYLAARWGYARAVHSWELLNEGDPFSGNHYDQADALGREIKKHGPNQHLVTTSFWHSYPTDDFWGNPAYPNLDYADFHAYIDTSWLVAPDDIVDQTTLGICGGDQNCYLNAMKDDSALYHTEHSWNTIARFPGKPTVRGEAGLTLPGTIQEPDPDLLADLEGLWLHKYLFSQINPGGLYEIYWFTEEIQQNDLYPIFKRFRDFMAGIPINNGDFIDAQAEILDTDLLRVSGMKDLIAGRAFLWIDHRDHTWKRVVNNLVASPADGRVVISGFQPNTPYPVQWWDTCSGSLPAGCQVGVSETETVTSASNGQITLQVRNLGTDIAVKIGDFDGTQ